jgi:predicted transcriptional regulator YdeE
MEIIELNQDIKVFYITANSFPEDVPAAYERLNKLIPNSTERRYFGISQPDKNGKIIYKAAAEEIYPNESEELNLESFIIKKGKFIAIEIKDHMKDGDSIGNAFKKLLSHPDIDPQGYCLEIYINYTDPDVSCMVGLKN